MKRLFGFGTWPMLDADGAGGGTSGAAGGQATGASGSQGDANNANAGGQQGGQGATQASGQTTPFAVFPDEKSFMARVQREGKKLFDELAKTAGFASAEELQNAAKAHKDTEEKNKTDLQKANEAKLAAEQKAQAAESTAKVALIKAAFAEAGIAANLVSVDDAFRLADLSGVTVKDDATVEGVKEVVEKLVKDKPYLVKPGSGGNGAAGTGGNPPRGGSGQADQSVEQAKQIAQQRNQQNQTAGIDPWGKQDGGVANQATQIAQAVAAAVAQVLGKTVR